MLLQPRFIWFLLLLFVGVPLMGQEGKTLSECIHFALKNNLQIQDVALETQLSGLSFSQSKWNRLPAIGAGSDAGMNYGRSVDPNTNGIVTNSFFNNTYYLGASVDLFRGFMLQNQVRYREFRKEASENRKINAADDLAFSVMNAFFNVLYYQDLLKIASEQKALSEMDVRKTQILVTTGLKSPTDLLEVKANFEREELFCIQTSNNLATAWITLKKAMNLPPEHEISLVFPPVENEISVDSTNIQQLFIQHSGWSPYLASFEREWMASMKNIGISRSAFSPSLKLQAVYNTGFYETYKDEKGQVIAFNDQISNNRRQFLGASLTIPLFGKNSARFSVQGAKIEAEQAKTRLEQARQNLLYEMEQNCNELSAAQKELKQSERQLEADNLTFQAAQKRFDQGMINAIELYTIKNRLANSAAQVLRARLTLGIKQRILEFYQGNRFWERGE
jgi:outer membrane protein